MSGEATIEEDKPLEEYDFFRRITEMPYVELIYLYGSRALGAHHARSDIDLAIACPKATDAQWQGIKRLIENAPILLKVDVVRLDKVAPGPYKETLHRQKRLIYARLPLADRLRKEYLNNAKDRDNQLTDLLKKLDTALSDWEADESKPSFPVMRLFNLAFDQLHRWLKRCLAIHGLRAHSPVSALRNAYAEGWIDDRLPWEQMALDMAATGPEHQEKNAPLVKPRLRAHLALMRDFQTRLREIMKPYYAQTH